MTIKQFMCSTPRFFKANRLAGEASAREDYEEAWRQIDIMRFYCIASAAQCAVPAAIILIAIACWVGNK